MHRSLHNNSLSPHHSRETDKECLLLILDTMLIFCKYRYTRDKMRDKQLYPLLRELDKVEREGIINEKIVDIVEILMLTDEVEEMTSKQTTNTTTQTTATPTQR